MTAILAGGKRPFGRSNLVLGRRRHPFAAVGRQQLKIRLSSGLPGRDRVVVGPALAELGVRGHFELAGVLLGVVAGVAVFLEDRGDVVDRSSIGLSAVASDA